MESLQRASSTISAVEVISPGEYSGGLSSECQLPNPRILVFSRWQVRTEVSRLDIYFMNEKQHIALPVGFEQVRGVVLWSNRVSDACRQECVRGRRREEVSSESGFRAELKCFPSKANKPHLACLLCLWSLVCINHTLCTFITCLNN